MKTQSQKINVINLGRGILYSFSTSLVLSFLISIIMIFISNPNSPHQNYFGSGLFILFIWAFYAGIVSLVASIIIGIPVTIILIKSRLDNEFISAIIGILIVLITIYISGGLDYFTIILCLYGFCCAYAFMKGYKQS